MTPLHIVFRKNIPLHFYGDGSFSLSLPLSLKQKSRMYLVFLELSLSAEIKAAKSLLQEHRNWCVSVCAAM